MIDKSTVKRLAAQLQFPSAKKGQDYRMMDDFYLLTEDQLLEFANVVYENALILFYRNPIIKQ